MSIHSEIKRLRLAKGWSHQQLAAEVSAVEGLKKPLSWQTVQQWEREPAATGAGKSTAPKRSRLDVVARLLGTDTEALMAGRPPKTPAAGTSVDGLTAQEAMLIAYVRMLDEEQLRAMVTEARERAAGYSVISAKRPLLGT